MLKELTEENHITIAAHGLCLHDVGRSAWGYLMQIRKGDQIIDQAHTIEWTDSIEGYRLNDKDYPLNDERLEMKALIMALSELEESNCDNALNIFTDNKCFYDGVTKLLEGRKANDWKQWGKYILNADYWVVLDRLIEGKAITWVWTEGVIPSLLQNQAITIKGVATTGSHQKALFSV